MHTLYPAIKPYTSYRLAVDTLHDLYLEECGTPDGIPVLVVHGGPGVGCSEKSRCFFDPEKYRIILFDQRGCGRSTPHGELTNNTTPHLISDMEKIREHIGIERWLLFGGSWGSTLSLLYAQAHPKRVKGFILRGIFLGRQIDLNWLYKSEGAARVFPEHWQEFIEIIPEIERHHLLETYYCHLTGDNELARMSAAKHWMHWEFRISTLRPSLEVEEESNDPHTALAMSRISAHYLTRRCFIEENQIIENMKLIKQIPAVIVHGRYDMVCPFDQAQALVNHWPQAELFAIRDAGHSAYEPGIIDALILATDKLASQP